MGVLYIQIVPAIPRPADFHRNYKPLKSIKKARLTFQPGLF